MFQARSFIDAPKLIKSSTTNLLLSTLVAQREIVLNESYKFSLHTFNWINAWKIGWFNWAYFLFLGGGGIFPGSLNTSFPGWQQTVFQVDFVELKKNFFKVRKGKLWRWCFRIFLEENTYFWNLKSSPVGWYFQNIKTPGHFRRENIFPSFLDTRQTLKGVEWKHNIFRLD